MPGPAIVNKESTAKSPQKKDPVQTFRTLFDDYLSARNSINAVIEVHNKSRSENGCPAKLDVELYNSTNLYIREKAHALRDAWNALSEEEQGLARDKTNYQKSDYVTFSLDAARRKLRTLSIFTDKRFKEINNLFETRHQAEKNFLNPALDTRERIINAINFLTNSTNIKNINNSLIKDHKIISNELTELLNISLTDHPSKTPDILFTARQVNHALIWRLSANFSNEAEMASCRITRLNNPESTDMEGEWKLANQLIFTSLPLCLTSCGKEYTPNGKIREIFESIKTATINYSTRLDDLCEEMKNQNSNNFTYVKDAANAGWEFFDAIQKFLNLGNYKKHLSGGAMTMPSPHAKPAANTRNHKPQKNKKSSRKKTEAPRHSTPSDRASKNVGNPPRNPAREDTQTEIFIDQLGAKQLTKSSPQNKRPRAGSPPLLQHSNSFTKNIASPTPENSLEKLQQLEEQLKNIQSIRDKGHLKIERIKRVGEPENIAYVIRAEASKAQSAVTDLLAAIQPMKMPAYRNLLPLTEFERVRKVVGEAEALCDRIEKKSANLANLDHETQLTDTIKSSARPKQNHLNQLLDNGEILSVSKPEALAATKNYPANTLFEIKITPKPLSNGKPAPPVVLHIHARQPVEAKKLFELPEKAIAAIHFKSSRQQHLGSNTEVQLRGGEIVLVPIHRAEGQFEFAKKLAATGLPHD